MHRGDTSEARLYLGRAARLRPLLTYALPVVSLQALLELARCYLTLADPGGTAAVLRQVHEILQQRPDLGVLPRLAGQLQSQLGKTKAIAVVVSQSSGRVVIFQNGMVMLQIEAFARPMIFQRFRMDHSGDNSITEPPTGT